MSSQRNAALVETIMDLMEPVIAEHIETLVAEAAGPLTVGGLNGQHLGRTLRTNGQDKGQIVEVEHMLRDGMPVTRIWLRDGRNNPALVVNAAADTPCQVWP